MIDIVPWARLRLRPVRQLYLLSLWRPNRNLLSQNVPIRSVLRVHLERPLELPNRVDLLSRGHDLVHSEPSLLRVQVVEQALTKKGFLDQLPRLLPDHNGQVLLPRMSTNGKIL